MDPILPPAPDKQPRPDIELPAQTTPPTTQPVVGKVTVTKAPYTEDPAIGQVSVVATKPSKARQLLRLIVFAVGLIIVGGVIWVSYESFFGKAHTVFIGDKSMQVASMTAGSCKGRMQVKGMTYMGGPLCLDNTTQAKSMAAMEIANPRPNLGMVYTGLAVAPDGSPCAGLFMVSNLTINGQPVCTHGPDPAPTNVPSPIGETPIAADQDITNADVAPGSGSLPAAPSNSTTTDNSASSNMNSAKTVAAPKNAPAKVVLAVQKSATKPLVNVKLAAVTTPSITASLPGCPQPGSDGDRVQPLYVHFSGQPDNINAYKGTLAAMIRQTDEDVASSATLTNGTAHLRWLTDASCNVIVNDVTVTTTNHTSGTDWLNLWFDVVNSLATQGYKQNNHKYLIFVDTQLGDFCGAGENLGGEDNLTLGKSKNDIQAGYAEVGGTCWQTNVDSHAPIHELMHTLGAVSPSAPYGTAGLHCTDSSDLMCYNDGPGVTQQNICPADYFDTNILDCQENNYFSASPAAGSYLATHWNVYNSGYVVHDNGSEIAPKPTGVSFSLNGTPDTFYFKRGVDYSTQYYDANNPTAGWQSLGGVSTSAPTVVSYAPNNLMVFIRGGDDAIYVKHFNGSNWGGWTNIAPFAGSNVAAVSPAPNKVYIYYRAISNGNLITRGWNTTIGWSALGNLGGSLDSDPVAISTSATNIEVYAIAGGPHIPYRIVWNGTVWSPWQQIGGQAVGNPAVVASATGRRDLFVRGANNHMYAKTFQNGAWTAWLDLGGSATGSPAAVASSSGTITVYARGSKAQIYKRSLSSGAWSPWQLLPSVTALSTGDISAISVGGNPEVLFHNTAHLTFKFDDTATPSFAPIATQSAFSFTPAGAPNFSL